MFNMYTKNENLRCASGKAKNTAVLPKKVGKKTQLCFQVSVSVLSISYFYL